MLPPTVLGEVIAGERFFRGDDNRPSPVRVEKVDPHRHGVDSPPELVSEDPAA